MQRGREMSPPISTMLIAMSNFEINAQKFYIQFEVFEVILSLRPCRHSL